MRPTPNGHPNPDSYGGGAFVTLDRVLPGNVPTLALLVRVQSFSGRLVFHLDPQVGWFRCDRHSQVWEPSSLRAYLESLPQEEAERIVYEIECNCLDWLANMRSHRRPAAQRSALVGVS